MKLWQKDSAPEDWVTRFTVGEDYRWDTLLLPYDVEGTRAQAWALEQIGLLTAEERRGVDGALDRLMEAYAAGTVEVTPDDEDCHTVIEHHLTRVLGETGKKIHTGRSRNDQVLTALRLFLRDHLRRAGRDTAQAVRALCVLGRTTDRVPMPGYTHFQRAMPTTAGAWALGYAELLLADLDALRAAHDQVNVSPWGSAAGYGVPYLDMPRDAVAERLGFRGVQRHVTAVQLSRGKLELHVLHALVQVSATLNRMAADLVLFTTAEFGFVRLPDAYCTGSSIMPQKRNPDVLELVRASHHRLLAEMSLLATLPANLPSGYHRDLQLTKEAVMRGMHLGLDVLVAVNHVLPGVEFLEQPMREAHTPDLFATARALDLVRQGVSFREAYRTAGRELEKLETPDLDKALDAYVTAGYPGRGAPDALLAALDRQAAWAYAGVPEAASGDPLEERK